MRVPSRTVMIIILVFFMSVAILNGMRSSRTYLIFKRYLELGVPHIHLEITPCDRVDE